MSDKTNQLELIVRQSGLEITSPKAKQLLDQFSGYFDIAADWEKKASAIVVTDASQTAEMKMAREGRLFLREKRIAIEKKRKELKEQALREGKAIDGMANILKALIVPIEEYLDKQEKFLEIKAAEETERLRIEAENKAEQERIAKEKAEAEEREHVRLENERLKKEAEEKERKMQEERAAAEAEKKRQEEALAAEKAKAEAERKRIEQEREAERKKVEAEREKERQKAAAEKAKAEKEHQRKQAELEAKLKSIITCPHCNGKLYPDGSKAHSEDGTIASTDAATERMKDGIKRISR